MGHRPPASGGTSSPDTLLTPAPDPAVPSWTFAATPAPIETGAITRRKPVIPYRNARRLATFTKAADIGSGSSTLWTTAADPVSGVTGTDGITFTTNGTTVRQFFSVALATPVDVTNCLIRFPMLLSGKGRISKTDMLLSSDANTSSNAHRWTSFAGNVEGWTVDGRWMMNGIHVSSFAQVNTGANLAAINRLRIDLADDGTGAGLAVTIPWIEAVPMVAPKAKCVIWFDDALTSAFTIGAPMMARYGFPGTLAPNLTRLDLSGFMSVEMVRKLVEHHGWQVATHAYTVDDHNGVLTGPQIDQSFQRSRRMQAALGYDGGDDFAYYGGAGVGVQHSDPMHSQLVRKQFRSARTTFGQGFSGVETLPPIDPWRTKAFQASNGQSLASMTAWVDKAIQTNGLAQFVFHDNLGTPADATVFQQLLDYLNTNRASIDVVTISDALNVCY